ncbi:thiamine pyrophosphate-binding protein [Sphaerisporangium sp. TRM90804]|uniref:thiamine pyrophosphate-binding protein n=1 Tax=Sphaerisporangium sp. TRM90804 TaxID=3031113 RepID=UPI0024491AA6|nr:thiamine pyrophosphate-binding protein [Sphaerisporangium sp. TRM90804]MDH2424334.1 thiamine pyrophosphate-binding protein [Sphaerisporangium sp. TRM90804]
MQVTGARLLTAALRLHGVDTVFGIPGTHNLALYQELQLAGVRCVTSRHEQGAGYAADGYARATGRPGVLVTTTGPGAVNAATAMAQAYSDSSAVLLVTTGLPTGHPSDGRGYLHESKDQLGALEALCAWGHRAASTGDIADTVARAFRMFAEERPRPVYLEVPVDLLQAPADLSRAVPPSAPALRRPEPAAIEQAARVLSAARRPAVVLGGGTWPRGGGPPAGPLALRLAERLAAPVVTTVNGKGTVPESHPLSLGATLHLASVRRWLAGCDAVLAVGTELAPSDLWVEDFTLGGTLVRVDIDPAQMGGGHPAGVPVVADAALALRALLDRLPPAPPAEPPGAFPPGAEEREMRDTRHDELVELTRRWAGHLDALRRSLPRDAVVVGDNSMLAYRGAVGGLPVDAPGRFLFPTGYGTLGFALPAAIGVKAGLPHRPVAVLAGDGALQFSVQELATAVELRLALPIVVPLNGGYGEIRAAMLAHGMRPVGVDLHMPDFVALAEAYGARGRAVTTPDELGKAVTDALDAAVPTVIAFAEEG